MISQGEYDQAIDLQVQKLTKNPSPDKAEQLKQIVSLANSRDLSTIRVLKATGNPDIWHQVFNIYEGLEKRQQKIAALPTEIFSQTDSLMVSYEADIKASRQKTAEYYYALAQQNMKNDDIQNYRATHQYLKAIQEVFPGFRDVDKLLKKIEMAGPVYIFYHIQTDYPYTLPPGTENSLESIDISMFDTPKFQFLNQKTSNDDFKYFVKISLINVQISPDRTGELSYTESAAMQDGIAYKLDENGDFVLNENGQKTEIPKFKTLVCYVNDYKQQKGIRLIGLLEIIDPKTEQIIYKETVLGESVFENHYAKFKGDIDALSPETFQLVGTQKLAFPADANMILHAGHNLCEDAAKKVIGMLENIDRK